MTKTQAESVYAAAQRMSNWLYNVGQQKGFESLRSQMHQMVSDWDNSKAPLAKLTIPAKRALKGGK